MAKSDLPIGGEYAPVADRIRLFYDRFPSGQILTELVSRADGEITFIARVYRQPDEQRPSATGWASERVGDGEVNSVACLENTETSAIGRALANLGFTASKNRPSAEEMAKVTRERTRQSSLSRRASDLTSVRIVRESASPVYGDALQDQANEVVEVLRLLDAAEREGLRSSRTRRLRARLTTGPPPTERLTRIRQRLRHWLARQRARRLSPVPEEPTTDGTVT